jgi:myosin heavy subunit
MADPNSNSIQSTPGPSSSGQQLGDAGRDSKPLPPIGYEFQQQLVPVSGPSSLQAQSNLTGEEIVDRALDKFAEQSREAASLRTLNIQLNEDLNTRSDEYDDLRARYNNLVEVKNALQNKVDNEPLRRKLNKVKEVQSMQSSLEKSKRELSDANTKLINKERDIRQQKDELEAKERKIKSQQNSLDKLRRTAEEHVKNIRALKIELESVETELERKKEECRRLEDQSKMKDTCIQDIEKELNDLKSSSESQAHHIRELQEKAFRRVEEGQWMPDTNREVSDQLNGLCKQMQRWCRNFSRKSMLRIGELTEDDQTRLHDILSQVAHTVNGEYVFQFEDPTTGSRLPEVLLMSALSHDLYKAIFSNPFFFESQPETSTGIALAKLWSDLLKGNASNFSIVN